MRWLRRKSDLLAVGFVLAALVSAAPPALGAPEELARRIADAYRVQPLSGGWLLEPLDGGGEIPFVEIAEGELLVAGEPVTVEELEASLGQDGVWLFELTELEPTELGETLERARKLGPSLQPPRPPRPPRGRSEDAYLERVEAEREVAVEEAERNLEAARRRAERELEALERRLEREGRRIPEEARVTFGSPLTIDEDEVADQAVVIGGPLTVRGVVAGDAVAVAGPVRVEGEVRGSVISIGAGVELADGARVGGDVVAAGGRVERAPGAVVGGKISEVSVWGSFAEGMFSGGNHVERAMAEGRRSSSRFRGELADVVFAFVWMAVFLLLGGLAVLLAGGALDRAAQVVERDGLKAGVVGFAIHLLFFPALLVVFIMLCVSIIGIPVALVLLPAAIFGFGLLALFGYVVAAVAIGRLVARRLGRVSVGGFGALVLGLVVVHCWWIFEAVLDLMDGGTGVTWPLRLMLFLFALLVQVVVWSVGLGGALLAYSARRERRVAALAGPTPPSPPAGPVGGGDGLSTALDELAETLEGASVDPLADRRAADEGGEEAGDQEPDEPR